MVNLLVELENKVEQIEREKYISLSNVNGDLLEHLNYAKKELSSANSERKRNLKIDILKLEEDIKYNETEIDRLYNNKKIVMYKDTMKKIKNEMKKIKNDLVSVIREKSDELRNLKNEIVQANNLNNFILVEKLSLDARKLNTNISYISEKFQETNKLISYIEKTLDNIDNLSFEEIVSEFNKNKVKITEIWVLFNKDSTEKNKNKKEKELKNKIDLIKKILEKAKTNNDEKDLGSANKLIKELPEIEDKKALQQKAVEVKEIIEKNKQELEIKNKIDSIKKLLEKAKTNNDKKDLELANKLIKELPEIEDKKALQQSATQISEIIQKKLKKEEKLFAEIAFTNFKNSICSLEKDYDKHSLDDLSKIINNLKKDSKHISNNLDYINLDEFKKYLKRLNDLIYKYDADLQSKKRNEVAENLNNDSNGRLNFKQILKLSNKYIKNKIFGKKDNIKSVPVLLATNGFKSLKYKVYKEGLKSNSKKIKIYNLCNKIICRRALSSLLKQEIGREEDCQKWLEFISKTPKKLNTYFLDGIIRKYDMMYFNSHIADCFSEALKNNKITEDEYEYYINQLEHINQYRDKENDFYVIPDKNDFITYVDEDSIIKRKNK